MAKALTAPPALYDYILYYECAKKDWLDFKKKSQVKGDGSLMDAINWSVSFSIHPNDTGGATKFGITESTWKSFVKNNPNKGYNKDLNSMNKQGWMDVVGWFWDSYSYAGQAANYACACLLFQMAWGGFASAKKLVDVLQKNADIKDYIFIKSGSTYKKIADATHAYTDPMKAFGFMRQSLMSYYYNISSPNYINSIGKKNDVYRVGWLNRVAIPFTMYGLYADVTLNGGKGLGLKYSSSLDDWDSAITRHMQSGGNGIVKLIDWGVDPESIKELIATTGEYNMSSGETTNSSFSSSPSSSGAYGGCGGVYQLGDYSNAPDMQIVHQQVQNREEVLNTLLCGSYMPDDVKKCAELITSDKKKNVQDKIKNTNV